MLQDHTTAQVTVPDFETLTMYRGMKLAVGGAEASLGYEQVNLSATRVDPGSVTRHVDHDDVGIVPVGESPAVVIYRASQ